MSSPPPQPRTTELRRDLVSNRWVILSPARSRRPSDLRSRSPATASTPAPNPNPYTPSCPFCIGNEHLCAPEIFRLPPSSPSWHVRVIQNLYPALRRDLPPHPTPFPSSTSIPGFGFHDVIIETPLHSLHLSDLPPTSVGDVLLAYKERILQLKPDVKYVQVFKNHGASAGASLSHSHSQIVGMPVVPPAVTARLESMRVEFERTGKCVLCEDPLAEILVDESEHFWAIVPFAASFPFEIWIVPQDHCSHFHEIDSEKAVDLGGLLKLMLSKLSKQLNDPPFNFMIHTAPLELPDSGLLYAHWYLQIVPQLSVVGGFEAATGCYINPVFPEDAAKILREVNFSE